MRLCSVLMSAALLASALASARSLGRTRLAVGEVVLAITPMTLFLAGSVNPNGLEIAASIATFVVLLDLLTRRGPPPTRLLVRAVVVASCFVAARPLVSPLYFVLAIGCVVVAALTRERLFELLADVRARVAAGALAVVRAAQRAVDGARATALGRAPPGRTSALPERPAGLMGSRGLQGPADGRSLRVARHPPSGLVDARVALGGRSSWCSWRWWSTRRCNQHVTLLGAVAATVAVPIVIESVQAHEIGLYWQGRYSLPLAVGGPDPRRLDDRRRTCRHDPGRATDFGTVGVVVVAVGGSVRAALRLGHRAEPLRRRRADGRVLVPPRHRLATPTGLDGAVRPRPDRLLRLRRMDDPAGDRRPPTR